ncbi:MAG: hypothetical protein JWM80_6047, partial [Cyanobacteria bacterium RYN_339]|nr:hypothetical protein [Cyanobacteria bacterium RYN_339]
ATWRPVGDHAKIAAKPDLDWMRKVASAPDTVVMFGVGWYRRDGEGYSRHNGHWVDVVGVGEGDTQFLVHNPAIKAADQARKRTISLGKLDGFARLDSQRKPHDMSGYYAVKGPGLPFGAKTTAVLDAVMAFTVSM